MRKFHVVSDKHRKHPDAEITLPVRKTKHSAGYDVFSPEDISVPSKSSVLIWTDIKVEVNPDEYVELHIRSSLAIKWGLRLKNGVGIIDMDYNGNVSNDGNIGVCIENPTMFSYSVRKGDAIGQLIIKKYLTVEDDVCMGERKGGIGSTGN